MAVGLGNGNFPFRQGRVFWVFGRKNSVEKEYGAGGSGERIILQSRSPRGLKLFQPGDKGGNDGGHYHRAGGGKNIKLASVSMRNNKKDHLQKKEGWGGTGTKFSRKSERREERGK